MTHLCVPYNPTFEASTYKWYWCWRRRRFRTEEARYVKIAVPSTGPSIIWSVTLYKSMSHIWYVESRCSGKPVGGRRSFASISWKVCSRGGNPARPNPSKSADMSSWRGFTMREMRAAWFAVAIIQIREAALIAQPLVYLFYSTHTLYTLPQKSYLPLR